ncbi:hypothetical protein [Cyclobacterium qasimii]|nr:hypothetical protein [Cyclobacterium qasimii]GEO20110.1 hypothetical protein CQA01_06440 [Cyclobacterium qasimii]
MDIRGSQLHPDMSFHIFNRGINGAKVFFEEKNYHYFLKQYIRYVHPFVHTYAYCLLGNHFHILIRVRSDDHIRSVVQHNKEKAAYWHVSNAFSSFLQSYTRAMNKMYNRTGPIFESPFKRITVSKEAYFSRLLIYIHLNPEKHGIIADYRNYPYSSYQAYCEREKNTKLEKAEVLDWFGGSKGFLDFHRVNLENGKEIDENLFLE